MSKKWAFDMRQRVWDLFIGGYGISQIAEKVGRTENAIECEIWKEITHYNNTHERQLILYRGNRTARQWTERDGQVIDLGLQHKLPPPRIAQLLGRSYGEVEEKIKKRQRKKLWETPIAPPEQLNFANG